MRWCVVFLCHYVGLLHIIKRRRLELSGLFLVSYGKVTLIEITGCRDEREERLCSCYVLFSYKANVNDESTAAQSKTLSDFTTVRQHLANLSFGVSAR